jgi:hypothetical protein
MKHPRRLTREQKILLDKLHLNPRDWLRVKDTTSELVIVHKHSDKTIRTIRNGAM